MLKFFIDRPIFASVIAILIFIAGLFTITTLPIAQYPEITPPTINVSASYPGADASTIAQTIGVPIEEKVNGVEGMMYMSSSSSSNGTYSLTVTFELGTDINMASVLVQNRVNEAQGKLPEAVIEQGITTQKQSTNIVMFVSLTSKDPLYDALYLTNYAQINLINRLSRLPGVGGVSVFGAGNYSMRIWMDPEKMRIRGLDPSDVYNAIAAQNQEISSGAIGAPPANSNAGFQYTLNVPGRLSSVEEFENIVIKSNPNGSFLRLKDIATIDLGSQSYSMTSSENGMQNAAIGIYQLPGANALDVANEISKEVEYIKAFLPEGIECEVVLNTANFVKASIKEIIKTFVETLLLVILVILLFLQSFRAMLIPVIVIPISIIGTFALMKVFGFTINTLTLFGLVLAIAIVVDDAIVVVENATRYLTPDKLVPPAGTQDVPAFEKQVRREAVIEAMKDIIGPVVGIVIVLLSVFIPTGFIGGITGQLYRQFALTIAFATFLSGVVSILFTPAMCAIFLTPDNKGNKDKKQFFLFRWFNKVYGACEDAYVKVITKLLNFSKIVVLAFLVFLAFTIWLFIKTPTSFLPDEDQGYFIVAAQLPAAASLERTAEIGSKLEEYILTIPGVETVLTINGYSMMGGGAEPNAASLFIVLKPWSERTKKSESAFAITDRINEYCASWQEATVYALVPPPIPGLGVSSGLNFELEDINSYGPFQLQTAVDELVASARDYPEIEMLQTQYQASTPLYMLNINRDKLELMGLSISEVFSTISAYMGSSYVNDYVEFDRIFQVLIQGNAQSRSFIEGVMKLSVKNPSGNMVPVSTFASLVEQVGANDILRYNMYTAASIIAISNPAYSSSQTMVALGDLVKQVLGNNYAYEWTSMAYQEKESSSQVIVILFLAVLLVFLVLSAQYESLLNPIAVLMGVPFAILGAIVGTKVMGLSISLYSQIGIVLLIALSAKNAILIVQFAMDYHAKGESVVNAAIEAGKVRLRPILMTSFAFIFGVMPLMFATGAGARSRIFLGTTVVFGMLFNTLFGTLFIPNFYHFMNERLFGKKKNKNIQQVAQKQN